MKSKLFNKSAVLTILLALSLLVLIGSCGGSSGDDDDNDSNSSDDDSASDDDNLDDDSASDDDDNDDNDNDDNDDTTDDDDDNDTSGSQTIDVSIQSHDVNPGIVTIAVGDTVRWTNNDLAPHTVTSGNPGDSDAGNIFDSGLLSKGDTFEFTFDTAGSYSYFCKPHQSTMFGYLVIVE